jgi:phosphatidylinositol 4-kinase
MEFAPSDRAALLRRQQAAHNLLVPHTRLLQFFGSHFNATRLGSAHLQKMFHRMLGTTLGGLKHSTGHPLARELRCQLLLFALKVLRYSTATGYRAQWRLKDNILDAALTWGAFPPRLSFGGNRLQLKAEMRLLSDVQMALQSIKSIGQKTVGALVSLQPKEDLFLILLENEQTRLTVWLDPLHTTPSTAPKEPAEVSLATIDKFYMKLTMSGCPLQSC